MRGAFSINGYDTYSTWGIILAEGSVDALLSIPPAKEYIVNESRLEDGVRVLAGRVGKDADREVTLEVHMIASSATDSREKYASFVQFIKENRTLDITTENTDGVFHFLYRSCNTFSDWNGRVSHIALRLWEPNPADREDHTVNTEE